MLTRSAFAMTLMAMAWLAAGGAGAVAADDSAAPAKSTTVTMARSIVDDATYDADGGTLDVRVVWTSSDEEDAITYFDLRETLPEDWEYVGILSGPIPDAMAPATGATGTLRFRWNANIPATFPVTFIYRVSVPAGETGSKHITGYTTYDYGTGTNSQTSVIDTTIKPPRFVLTTVIDPTGGGTVTATPSAGTDGKYELGTVVQLTARAATDYTFVSWDGVDTAAANTATVVMNDDRLVTATFEKERWTLTLVADPVAGGEIVPNRLPGDDGKYEAGATVQLTAVPTPGYEVVVWTGVDTSSGLTATVKIDDDLVVTAFFQRERRTLTLQIEPDGGGTIQTFPEPDLDGKFPLGTEVNLWAVPGPDYEFVSWQGIDTSFEDTATITMNANRTVKAVFESTEPPDNDDFADRLSFGAVQFVQFEGTNKYATSEPGEPVHADVGGGASAWWSWTTPELDCTKDETPSAELVLKSSDFGAVVVLYTGTAVDGLTEVGRIVNPEAGTGKIAIEPYVPGQTYHICLDGYGADVEGKASLMISCRCTYVGITYCALGEKLNTKIAERALPFGLSDAPQGTIGADAALALRVTAASPIDLASISAVVKTADGAAIDGSAVWQAITAMDGWVVFTPSALWPEGQITMTVAATTEAGEAIGPISETYRTDATKSATMATAGLVEDASIDALPEIIGAAASKVYRVAPAGVYAAPMTVRIPLAAEAEADKLDIYYYSESMAHPGWYRGENVIGWIVEGSRRTVDAAGQRFIEIQVNHSGVLQLGKAIKMEAGSLGAVDLGATGGPARWASFAGAVVLLSVGLGLAMAKRRAH